MGLIRYWQPPTSEESLTNCITLFSGLAVIFYFFFIAFGGHLSRLFFFSLWLFSIIAIITGIKMVIKSGKSIGIDIGIVALIFLIGSIILHIFITYYYFGIYLPYYNKQPFFLEKEFYEVNIPIILFSLIISVVYFIKTRKIIDFISCLGQSTTLFVILNIYFIIMIFLGFSFTTTLGGLILYLLIKNLIIKKYKKKNQSQNEKKLCPKCDASYEKGDRFCNECGTKFKRKV